MSGVLVKAGDDILSGIKTEAMIQPDREYSRPGFRVTWIEWDSDFRKGGLQIEDLIVEVDGKTLESFLQPGKMGTGIGQPNESMYWEKISAKAGQPIWLKVMRGEQTLEVTAKLHPDYFYYDNKGRPALGPGGPPRLTPGEPFTEWSMWYERLVWKLSYLLDGAWDWRSINNRKELQEHEDHKTRIEYLLKTYPGPFADTVMSDWTAVRKALLGKVADKVDLEYREFGAKRAESVKQEAGRAWSEFHKEYAPDFIPTFPVVDVNKRESVVGKLVELPWITMREIVSDLGKSYAVVGSASDGFYIVPLSNPDIYRFYETMHRYQTQVNPRLGERYQYVGRILDEPRMITFQGRAITGLSIQVVAARAGQEELFVDLMKPNQEGKFEFAGEMLISQFNILSPVNDALPSEVVEAMIRAIKFADEKLWKSLFAASRVMILDNGHAIYDPSSNPSNSALSFAWEYSRKYIMSEVYDARVSRIGPVRRILLKDESKGLPDADEVYVFVDHYGLFENEYRSFVNMNVNRRWSLQRLNNGPWKITSVDHL
ncbi:MAG: hypothetical protein QG670_2434 [Thermoproteota archaeon]|nr:hypothetical protein [Thermoproteota archaeon]